MMLASTPTATAPLEKGDRDMLAVKETARPVGGLRLGGKSRMSAEKIDETAQEFESQFVSQMLSSMFSTIDTHEALGGSDAEEVYQSMMMSEYGKLLSRTGGVGVAAQVKEMLLKQQEVE